MVLGYDYSNQKRQWRRTDVPPLQAILMAMAVRRCDTEDAAIGQLIAPYCPGGRQGDSTQINNVKFTHFAQRFDGRGGVPILYCTHRPMEEVHGFPKRH